MNERQKKHTQKSFFVYLEERLEKRLEQAQKYPNLRHAIKDELETITNMPKSKQDMAQFKFFGIIGLALLFEMFLILIPIAIIAYIFWIQKKKNKIRVLIYTAPINDTTEDKLDTLLHSSPTHTYTQHNQDFEIFPSSENPWIK